MERKDEKQQNVCMYLLIGERKRNTDPKALDTHGEEEAEHIITYIACIYIYTLFKK